MKRFWLVSFIFATSLIATAQNDYCGFSTRQYASISTTTSAVVISGTTSKKVYICEVHLVAAAATNVAIVEGTGSVCGTATKAFPGFPGTTAATGWNFAANGGIVISGGNATVAAEYNAGEDVCILVSAANQISGGIAYVVF